MSTGQALTDSPAVARAPWCVHVLAYGHDSGGYEFASEREAQDDAADRRATMARGIKGLCYIVSQR